MSRCAVARRFQKQGIRLQLKFGAGRKAPLRSPSTGETCGWRIAAAGAWTNDCNPANGRPFFDAKLMNFYLGGLRKARLPE
jgi:hypothetical protein